MLVRLSPGRPLWPRVHGGDDAPRRRPLRSLARRYAHAVSAMCLATAGIVGHEGQGLQGQVVRPTTAARSASDSTATPHRQWVEMRNVELHVSDSVAVRVRMLHGEVLRTVADRPAALDDARSFRIRVTAGHVALTGADLGGVLNTVVFAYPGAPLHDIQLRTDRGGVVQTGIIHKGGVDLHFRLRGALTLMPDGRVRIHPTSMRVLGVSGEKAMHLVGLHLDNFLDLRGAHGASVKGDDLFLDPLVILPPPAIEGKLTSIAVVGDSVVEDFAKDPDDSLFGHYVRSDPNDPNFIYFRGGLLRFGKLLMTDTDLRIVDADPRTPFDMDLPHYTRQLVAGRSRTLANGGLVVEMPDAGAGAAGKDGGKTDGGRTNGGRTNGGRTNGGRTDGEKN